MNDLEKLRVILPHWIEHNVGHGKEFAKWADALDSEGEAELSELLKQAETFLLSADSVLKKALVKAGGELGSENHHHHSHDHKH